MRSARLISATCVGLLVTCCGCYHYGHFGPGGQYPPMAPGGYPPPMMTPVPSTPYVPSYNSQGVSPTPISPNGTPTPTWQSSPSEALPGNPNAAPPYDSSAPGNKPVPNPTNEEQNFGGAPAGASLQPRAPAGISGSGIELQPIDVGSSDSSSNLASQADPFAVSAKPVSTNTSRPNPFSHDPNFAWLRGVLSFDSQDQRWMILYDDNPDASDRYGGSLTLSDHAMLNRLKPDDVAYIEGSVSTNSLDKDSKPLYTVTKVVPLRPKN